ncbi:MAG TPA: DUF1326 domain-containing protein [Blastocatellia bacterium]|nr:DUF1326 domain-containing protein [Blastocatellia bacterium]
MRKFTLVLSICFAALLASSASAQQIYGEYIESRNADVYTGHCFAMSEVNLMGDQAIVGWRVSKGEWQGVKLDGLSVVGVAKASGTLGNPYDNPFPAKAILIVDEKATPEQREALKSFAAEMGGELLKNVVRTEAAPISLSLEFRGEHPSGGKLQAGELATIIARSLTPKDTICGHEQTYYPPLTPTKHTMPVAASLDQFNGDGLGVKWSLREKRSAYVGHFAR